jgi:hypothetical protein
MMYNQFERRKVTQRKDGCVYKTKVLYTKWFAYNKQPKEYEYDQNDEFWCITGKTVFQDKEPT